MWMSLKELLKGNSSKEVIYKEVQHGKTISKNKYEIADMFNKYFVQSVPINMEENSTMNITNNNYIDSEFKIFSKIDKEQLHKLVVKLKDKSGTEEGITVEVMKKVISVAGTKLCYLLNKSLEEGIFPSKWKEAIVIPIPKIKRTKKVEEFRPINKLPIYEKILEIIVHRQLINYLEENKILEECQSGFRAKHSCETALQWVITGWKK